MLTKYLTIGPSTGWLYAENIFLVEEQQRFLKEGSANAVEICLGSWENYAERSKDLEHGQAFDECLFRSIHLPQIDNLLDNNFMKGMIKFISQHHISSTVTHPQKIKGEYPIKSYERLFLAGFPLAIENMDKDKDSGIIIGELVKIIGEYNLRFVLDVQHAFEHDNKMVYARELFDAMKDRVTHLHVSGELDGNNHSLLYEATNADVIIDFLGEIFSSVNVPIILEGEFKTIDELFKETTFLKRELCFRP